MKIEKTEEGKQYDPTVYLLFHEGDPKDPLAIFDEGDAIPAPREGEIVRLRKLKSHGNGSDVETKESETFRVEEITRDYSLVTITENADVEEGEATVSFIQAKLSRIEE